MIARMNDTYKGEPMAIKAAYRATGYVTEYADEACCLLVEQGWTWSDVLTVNS